MEIKIEKCQFDYLEYISLKTETWKMLFVDKVKYIALVGEGIGNREYGINLAIYYKNMSEKEERDMAEDLFTFENRHLTPNYVVPALLFGELEGRFVSIPIRIHGGNFSSDGHNGCWHCYLHPLSIATI